MNNELLIRTQRSVAAYCSTIGLPEGNLSQQGRLDLEIDDRPLSFCVIRQRPPGLWIGSEIGIVDPNDRSAFTWLISACRQPWLYRGERIGLLPNTTTAVIYTIIPAANISDDILAKATDALLETSSTLASKLSQRDFYN